MELGSDKYIVALRRRGDIFKIIGGTGVAATYIFAMNCTGRPINGVGVEVAGDNQMPFAGVEQCSAHGESEYLVGIVDILVSDFKVAGICAGGLCCEGNGQRLADLGTNSSIGDICRESCGNSN